MLNYLIDTSVWIFFCHIYFNDIRCASEKKACDVSPCPRCAIEMALLRYTWRIGAFRRACGACRRAVLFRRFPLGRHPVFLPRPRRHCLCSRRGFFICSCLHFLVVRRLLVCFFVKNLYYVRRQKCPKGDIFFRLFSFFWTTALFQLLKPYFQICTRTILFHFFWGAGGMLSLPLLTRLVLEGQVFISFSWVGFFVAYYGHFLTKARLPVRSPPISGWIIHRTVLPWQKWRKQAQRNNCHFSAVQTYCLCSLS